jgi:hypothetical protein
MSITKSGSMHVGNRYLELDFFLAFSYQRGLFVRRKRKTQVLT